MRIKPHLNGALLYVCQISLTSRFQPKPLHFVSLHDTFRFCDYICLSKAIAYNTAYLALYDKPRWPVRPRLSNFLIASSGADSTRLSTISNSWYRREHEPPRRTAIVNKKNPNNFLITYLRVYRTIYNTSFFTKQRLLQEKCEIRNAFMLIFRTKITIIQKSSQFQVIKKPGDE